MYSSGYSQVSKSSPQAQKKMQYRSRGKSCSYYMRIVFFFSSLIQSLIIVSLVLFLVYGKPLDSASTSRIQDLEESFSRLSLENVALRQQRKNLTNLLNTTLTEKARNDWDLMKIRHFTNISAAIIQDIDKKLQQCNSKLFFCESKSSYSSNCPTTFNPTQDRCNCGLQAEQMKARLELVESNFTQTCQRMRIEMDQTAKERDNINLEVIRLRRDKSTHEKEVAFFRQKCKEDFSQSLSGIANVSKAFLDKIESLFPSHIPFQLTCVKQREHLEQIRTNCTSLSLEVEDKLQRYLNSVGGQVSVIQAENSRVKAENWRLSEDYRWCSNNRTGLILQNRQNLDKLQRKHDEDKERLLMDKMKLHGEIEVLTNNVKYKSRAIDHLTEQNRQLNMSCMSKTGFGGFPHSQPGWGLPGGGSSSASSSGFGQLGRTGSGGLGSSFGSFGSPFNKPASPGAGSSSTSLFNSGSSSSIGSGFNKPASSGTGSSTSLFNSGSSSSIGSGYNKPASSGTGSSTSLFNSGSSSSLGSAFNKPASSGSSSSIGSAFNKPASTGTGLSSTSLFNSGSSSSIGSAFNKPASSGSSSSIGSAFNKPASSGSSSSIGSAFNKPASTGTGSSSTSLFNSGSSSSIGSAFNKPASSGSSSSIGSAFNKPASTGTGSGSSGIGSNKPTTSVKSTSGVGSSSGSTTNKSGSSSSGFSWFGLGSSNSGSKPGSGTGKGPSPGSSFGGAGSSFGAGRTNGFGGGQISVAQHLRDLQRIINPSIPEENQDLSRMLG